MEMQKANLINGPYHNKTRNVDSGSASLFIESEDAQCIHVYTRSGLFTFTFVETVSAEQHISTMLARPLKTCHCNYKLVEHTCVKSTRTVMGKCRCPQCGGQADHYMYIEKRNLPEESDDVTDR